MKIVKFLGGLGNQMFQFAFYKALENKGLTVYADLSDFNNYRLHNGYELRDIFNVEVKKAPGIYLNLLKPNQTSWFYRKLKRILQLKKSYREEVQEFSFDTSFINNHNANYYWGYWQNEQYFKPIENNLRSLFTFKPILDIKNQNTLEEITACTSVSIHIRRGDYLKESAFSNICDASYYNNALEYISIHIPNPVFYVFSDDIDWCEANLRLENTKYINWNNGRNSYKDMQLMSMCKHNIIANSTFSWWGAWLNANPNKIVISPKIWTNFSPNTLALNEWIKL